MGQKIISVSLNEQQYELFLALKKYYEADSYINKYYEATSFKINNSDVFKIAMVEVLKQKTVDNLKKYNSKYESK